MEGEGEGREGREADGGDREGAGEGPEGAGSAKRLPPEAPGCCGCQRHARAIDCEDCQRQWLLRSRDLGGRHLGMRWTRGCLKKAHEPRELVARQGRSRARLPGTAGDRRASATARPPGVASSSPSRRVAHQRTRRGGHDVGHV